jgi:hypothetical protein
MIPTALFTITVPISPICDVKGNETVHIISTPHFCVSPVVNSDPEPKPKPEPKISKLCMRLFEDSTMSPTIIMTDLKDVKVDYSSNWTTDSESDSESDWSGSADFSESDWSGSADFSESEPKLEPESEFRWSATP